MKLLAIFPPRRPAFSVIFPCPECKELDTVRLRLVSTPSVLCYYLGSSFGHVFRRLTFSVAQCEFELCVIAQVLQVASSVVTQALCVNGRVLHGKLLLVTSPPALPSLVNCMDIRFKLCDFNYDLTSVIIAWETIKFTD